MKKLLTFMVFGFFVQTGYSQIGNVAPNFTEKDINGNTVDLYSYLNQGKLVILDVSTTW